VNSTSTEQTLASAPWTRALREHREALDRLLDTIEATDDATWEKPRGLDGWSPAQIAEHLVLAYEAVLRDLSGAGSMRPRLGPWYQRLMRWFLLPHILFHQSIPLRSRAPREVRPCDGGVPRDEADQRLSELARRVELDLESALELDRYLTHPYFGPISPLQTLRFCAAHLEHHRRQILEVQAG
jgi:uncharacterized damage-inducible protein DinB